MTTLKTVILAAALVAGGATLAIAQNGPVTGNEPPIAGGAAASNPSGSGGQGMAPTKSTMPHKSMKKKKTKSQ